MTEIAVADDVLGKFARRQHDWFERVRKGSLEPEEVTQAVQAIINRRKTAETLELCEEVKLNNDMQAYYIDNGILHEKEIVKSQTLVKIGKTFDWRAFGTAKILQLVEFSLNKSYGVFLSKDLSKLETPEWKEIALSKPTPWYFFREGGIGSTGYLLKGTKVKIGKPVQKSHGIFQEEMVPFKYQDTEGYFKPSDLPKLQPETPKWKERLKRDARRMY